MFGPKASINRIKCQSTLREPQLYDIVFYTVTRSAKMLQEEIESSLISQDFCQKLRRDYPKLAVTRKFNKTYAKHRFGEQDYTVSLPVTFTPFASSRNCSARCVFCSETLIFKEASRLSASLRPRSDYFVGLKKALDAMSGLKVGLSLSGLESTDDPDWLLETLKLLAEFERGSPVEEKVLYSNATGLAAEKHGKVLIPALKEFKLSRAEISRHHYDSLANNQIMRFRDPNGVVLANVFEDTVRSVVAQMHVRLVCIVQENGISCAKDVNKYLEWAHSLGVSDVVFREFSRTHDLYKSNATLKTIQSKRVDIEELMKNVFAENGKEEIEAIELVNGYYYSNLRCNWRDKVTVTLETSDYELMKQLHKTSVIYKLIYHANGNLTADWDPDSCILLKNDN